MCEQIHGDTAEVALFIAPRDEVSTQVKRTTNSSVANAA